MVARPHTPYIYICIQGIGIKDCNVWVTRNVAESLAGQPLNAQHAATGKREAALEWQGGFGNGLRHGRNLHRRACARGKVRGSLPAAARTGRKDFVDLRAVEA